MTKMTLFAAAAIAGTVFFADSSPVLKDGMLHVGGYDGYPYVLQ